ncbi:MAG: hypothetical protein ABSE62_04930 [Chthoniobacteraceae bacterium]
MDRFRISLAQELLTSKEVCFVLKWSRSTLWRRKLEGLPFAGGRISAPRLAWWIEQRDAARMLKMDVKRFLKLPRSRKERLLARAGATKCDRLRR